MSSWTPSVTVTPSKRIHMENTDSSAQDPEPEESAQNQKKVFFCLDLYFTTATVTIMIFTYNLLP